jgi:hypothetical protein
MRSSVHDRRIRVVLIVLASLALADCGGGGGGGGSTLPANCVAPIPNLSGATVTAAMNHGDIVAISGGSAFGVKSPALPVVLDGATGATSFLSKWDGFWPTQNAMFNVAYRDVPTVSPPHGRSSNPNRYIAGAHYSSVDFASGFNVMFWKNRTIASFPAYTYASWYQRMDANWTFGLGNPPDNNLKMWDYSIGTEPYNQHNWYIEYNPQPTTNGSATSWNITDDSTALQFPDQNGHSSFWNNAVNPMSQWVKIELEIKYSNQSNGYIKLWENGEQKINYVGRTDSYPGTARSESIGGYARSQCNNVSCNNWRYFADVYLDYTPARIVLANSSNLSNATIIENQIPTNWSDTSITFVVNLGKFNSAQGAYLFVVNLCGQPSSTGIQIP